jgi:pimeloyl-ACP methyl ester carboxylesterase
MLILLGVLLALDTPGGPGKSVPSRPYATRGDCAAWLVSVMDELGISRAHVMGLSRGFVVNPVFAGQFMTGLINWNWAVNTCVNPGRKRRPLPAGAAGSPVRGAPVHWRGMFADR